MSKSTIKLLSAFIAVVLIITAGTVSAFVTEKNIADKEIAAEEKTEIADLTHASSEENTPSEEETKEKKHEKNNEKTNDKETKASSAEKNKAVLDYEALYLSYIDKNVEYFSRGMILCDLNDDNIPELFSIDYGGTSFCYHEMKDGSMIVPSENTLQTYININNLITPATFFENPRNFFGIYRNKSTGKKALVNSVSDTNEADGFDVISFDGNKLILKNEGFNQDADKKRDMIMSGYEVVKDGLYASYLLRGGFGGEHGSDAVAALKDLIAQFKEGKTTPEYDLAKDGEFFCYIRNVNIADNEIELVPVASITYEEYTNAMNSDKFVTVNGEDMSIQFDPNVYDATGTAILYQMPWIEYKFTVPTEEHPVSVIEGYIGNTPVKAKMDEATKVVYSELYCVPNEDVIDNRTGIKRISTPSEFFANYAQNTRGSHYKATVKNGKLEELYIEYRP